MVAHQVRHYAARMKTEGEKTSVAEFLRQRHPHEDICSLCLPRGRPLLIILSVTEVVVGPPHSAEAVPIAADVDNPRFLGS